ncbi:MAG TPA: GYF domain-containing protein [Verrucomicrobiae bacterium]|nr:GYF domain-containing protein [Verrucomicrobiae bacterium]
MNYQLRREGRDLGTFTLEELREKRASGELTGSEYVRCEGKFNWQPLDLLLAYGPEAMPPPVPVKRGMSTGWIWALAIVAGLMLVGTMVYTAIRTSKIFQATVSQQLTQATTREDGMTAASKPVTWTTNTLTARDANERAKEFRVRQWEQGYAKFGKHDQPWDADAALFLKSWRWENYGGDETDLPSSVELGRKLVKEGCDDPLILTICAVNCGEIHEEKRLLEIAVPAFEHSNYRAYPKFYALRMLYNETYDHSRLMKLEQQSLEEFRKAFSDGSFLPQDQWEIAESLLYGWGKSFFDADQALLYTFVQRAGKKFEWLALVLEGEYHINEAWKARGSGFANTVSAQGWQGFNDHLATARTKLTQAWELHPEWPLAPALMEYVSLGSSGISEMRQWFDRATAAQVDYPGAWQQMRWGLRPRWFGSEDAMLAFGETALNTGRFDTDIPRMLFDSISDIEQESSLPPGERLYGREDIWPLMKRMYEGYIKQGGADSKGWRSAYTAVAYYAGHYEVAREQLQAMNWKPTRENWYNWDRDLSLLPEEIAARTGSASNTVSSAEDKRDNDDIADALAMYQQLEQDKSLDSRTHEFVRHRLAELGLEQKLAKGEWIDLQPKDDQDPNWEYFLGKAHVLPDGALEVESGPEGHLLFSRVRVGPQFEVKGEFEVVRSSNKSFQAGIVMGIPGRRGDYFWNSFRIKNNETEHRIVNFGHGWWRGGVTRKADVQDDHNSFTFTLQNFTATASLNGAQVLQAAPQPRSLYIKNDDYRLGLGAFNDVNDAVIRYRNMKVRRLGNTNQNSAAK